MQSQNKGPNQVNLGLLSEEEDTPSSVFMMQANEKNAVIHWERYGNLNRLVNTKA